MKLPGVGQLLEDNEPAVLANVSGDENDTGTSSQAKASQIFSQAQIQQGNSTTYRFGQKARTVGVPTTSTSTWPHPLQKNLGKANLIQAERKQKREEAKTLETNIRVSITGWLHEKPKKLTQVCIGHHSCSLFCTVLIFFRFLRYPCYLMSRHFRRTQPHKLFLTLC